MAGPLFNGAMAFRTARRIRPWCRTMAGMVAPRGACAVLAEGAGWGWRARPKAPRTGAGPRARPLRHGRLRVVGEAGGHPSAGFVGPQPCGGRRRPEHPALLGDPPHPPDVPRHVHLGEHADGCCHPRQHPEPTSGCRCGRPGSSGCATPPTRPISCSGACRGRGGRRSTPSRGRTASARVARARESQRVPAVRRGRR